jgi:hypothetical protein
MLASVHLDLVPCPLDLSEGSLFLTLVVVYVAFACSLSSPSWTWTSNTLTLDFHTVMLLTTRSQWRLRKPHSSKKNPMFLSLPYHFNIK